MTVTPGDVRDRDYRANVVRGGATRVELRGGDTVDVMRKSGCAMLDELDNCGPGYGLISVDELTQVYSLDGPTVFGAFDAVEALAFVDEGLAPLSYYESGNITERVVFSEDPDAETIVSSEFLTDTALGVEDVCDIVDDAED